MLNFSVEPVGYDFGRVEADIRFRTIPGMRDEIVDATNQAARMASIYAYDNAPQGETGNLRAAINFTPARYRPGGAGGGGTWVAVVGVDETRAPHANWLLHGTGVFGPRRRQIYPKRSRGDATTLFRSPRGGGIGPENKDPRARRKGKGATLTFQKQGEPRRWRRSVAGQPAQDDWWEGAMNVAREVLRERIQTRT